MRGARFELFGPAHLAALVLTATVSAALVVLVRRRPASSPAVRAAIAATLLLATGSYLAATARRGGLSTWDFVPLHLCDFLIFVAVYALWSLRPLACEALFFTACTGTVLAMVTPDLREAYPDFRFLAYFACHGLVVAAAVVLTVGLGVHPRAGAPGRVLLLVNVYAACVAVVNVVWDANFLYLRARPRGPTLLDWMGPWPVYILVVEAIAFALFLLLDLPFRRKRASADVATTR